MWCVSLCVVRLFKLFVRFVCGLLRCCTTCDLFACFVVCVFVRAWVFYMFVCLFETYRVMLYGVFICGVLFVCVLFMLMCLCVVWFIA